MGKKKKKKKKHQKDVQSHLQELTIEQLIRTGKQSLEAGKPRDAISIFKFAKKKHGQSDEISTLLFRSYLMREGQLRKKNLIAEANTVKKQARDYMPRADQLSEEDMIAFVSTCSNKTAIDIYAGYMSENPGSPDAERFLANRLFKSDEWELLGKLDESAPLRRDAGTIRKAIPLMNAGKWEKALGSLIPISRSSPFAPIRMFCRAMVSFYNEDDKDMSKALSMIPDDFPLMKVVRNLRNTVGNNSRAGDPKECRLQCLWEEPVTIEKDMRNLLYDLRHKRFRQAEHSIADIADAIYPEDPDAARSFILETIWNMTFQYKIEAYEFRNLATDLLPPARADLLLTKTWLLRFHAPFTMAGQYVSLLDKEFPDPETRKIAYALILLYTVEGIQSTKFNIAKDDKGLRKYKKRLGIRHEDAEMLLIDMTVEAIRLDPANKQGYELLVRLARKSRPAKNAVEDSLTAMLTHFPDDPWPCLELAFLFYEKNAFRKAENILEEAMKRAPHDNRVIDRHAIALLISAEKNIHRKKFHLVERDIEKAEKLESKKITPFIIEKQIVFQIARNHKAGKDSADKTNQLSLFDHSKGLATLVKNELDSLPLFDRLRVLAILMTDVRYRNIKEKKHILKELDILLDKELKNAKELSSSDVIRLLTPLEKEYGALLPSRKLAPIFLKKQKDILRKVGDSEIIPVFDLIFEPEWFDLIKKEIKRRAKKATKKDRLLLEFYRATIQHIKGEDLDPDAFEEILEETPGPMMEELRTTSRRLSRHASGKLKKALEMFDFDILDEMPFFGGLFDDVDDDEFFPDDDIMDDLFPDDDMESGFEKVIEQLRVLESDPDMLESGTIPNEFMEELLENFESFVGSLSLKGAPIYVIVELREIIRADPRSRHDFDMIAELITRINGADRLSREARIVLFGDRRKTGK